MTSQDIINLDGLSDARRAVVERAISMGADPFTAQRVAGAKRVRTGAAITLPALHLESLSRGRGWCRKGRGDSAQWGERTDRGYRVYEPGRWVVGATDGFRRSTRVNWDVEKVAVGEETWFIAN